MKSICTIYSALIIITLGFSCRKEINPGEIDSSGSSARIKTYTEEFISPGSYEVNSFRLDYDGSGRLISLISESNSGDKFLYKYDANSYVTELYHSGELVMRRTSFIGRNQFVDSTVEFIDEDLAMTEKYSYTKNNQLLKHNEYDYTSKRGSLLYNTHHYVFDSYSNLIKDTDISSITTYDYYNNLKNTISISPPYIQQPVNLVKTTAYTIGGVTEIYNHTYSFDSNNRVSSEKIIKAGSSEVLVKKYKY